ncbi:MAG: TonB-dependent receptor, partial [Bacteroidota bacterium]|nr:TonB-dependent receptor [Bacteroidota bacterium]
LKNSLNSLIQKIKIHKNMFSGIQNSSFTEVNVVHSRESSEWIAGVNLWTDAFSEAPMAGQLLRDYNQETAGAFIQNNLRFSETISLETGLRGDYVLDYGFALLPRLSLLYKPGMHFTSRIGGGIGYKAPTIFTEESERIHLRSVLPVSSDDNELERSYGANWDLNYRAEAGPLGWSVNHLFFYTHLDNPLTLNPLPDGSNKFTNIAGFVDTKGTETNVRLELGDFKLFIGYTFTDTKVHSQGAVVQHPLTAKHRLNNVLMYELEERWKVGLEAYYFSRQRLSDGTYGREYWICGLMLERAWERFSLFLNFENFLDTRQTRFGGIYSGTITNPEFRDIYAPVDGFVMNGGVKLNLSE